jgi:hypothetical protein
MMLVKMKTTFLPTILHHDTNVLTVDKLTTALEWVIHNAINYFEIFENSFTLVWIMMYSDPSSDVVLLTVDLSLKLEYQSITLL